MTAAGLVMEGMPGQLDIFEKPIVQGGIIGGNYYQYKPTTSISDSNQLEFHVPGNGDYYIDTSMTLLNLKMQIVKDDGKKYAATDLIAPINNILDSVFSDVKVEFNQKQVSDSRNMHHYRCYIEDLFNYNASAKESHQTAALWFQDDAGLHDVGTNPALVKRFEVTKGSNVIDVAGRLHCDLFNISKYLLNEVDIRFTFVKNKPAVYLLKDSKVDAGKIRIQDATLWVRKVKVSPSILLAHANSLTKFTAKYPYNRVEMQNHTIPTGTSQHTLENIFLGKLPTRIMLGLVLHKSFSGDHHTTPFNFQHFNLNYLAVHKNGEQFNCRPYTPKYGTDKPAYALPYLQSFVNSGNMFSDDGYCVNMSDWQNGYCIYPFDFTPDLSASSQHWCLAEQGNIRIELGFEKALTEPITVIIYSEFREIMQIDRNREVIID